MMMSRRNRWPHAEATRSVAALGCVLLLVVLSPVTGIASEPITVVGIEEDWELVVAIPDANSTAPQVSCTISRCRTSVQFTRPSR